jgi:hypothetical protein
MSFWARVSFVTDRMAFEKSKFMMGFLLREKWLMDAVNQRRFDIPAGIEGAKDGN